MGHRRTLFRLRRLILPALLLAVAGALHAASRGLPAASHAITLDGRFDDWAPVLAQADQVAVDGNASLTGAGCHPTNPDRDCVNISGQGRDVVRAATTWDATNAYFLVARSSDYEKITHCAFVLDLDADGLAESTDRVLDITWSGGGSTTLKGVELLDYVPSAVSGDPLVCMDPLLCPAPGAVGLADGYTMRGTVGGTRWSESNVPGAAAIGDRMEVRVPWSALGVAAGTGILWHLAVAQDGKVSSAVDNVGGADGKAGRLGVLAVDVTPDREGVSASGDTVIYCHDVQNRGQFRDRYDVRAVSTSGASLSVRLDPTGRCIQGTPDALDANGDGDFLDPGDLRAPAAMDSNGDGAPEVELAGGGTASWVISVRLPASFHGAVDLTSVEARSLGRPALTARALDTTRTGPLALGVDVSRSGVAGATVPMGPFVLRNTTGGAVDAKLVAAGPAGWPLRLHSDASGTPGTLLASDLDGNGAWDGATRLPGALAPGEAWNFWITATIPPGTALDTRGDVELRAESASWPRAPGRAWGMVHVRSALELLPSYSSPALALPSYPGGVAFFPLRLVNSQAKVEAVTLSSTGALPAGYAQRWYSDPNGDGNPSDGAPVTAALNVPAFGGVVPLVAAVVVPETGAGTGASAGTLATGTSASAIARTDVVLPAIVTSGDPHAALGRVRFPPCATVHARVSGLLAGSGSGYVLRRKDPSGATVDAAPLVSDRYGVAWASFPSWGGAPAGTWQLVLESNGTITAAASYTVEQPAFVQLDVPAEAQPGEALLVDARLGWMAAGAPLEESAVRFEILDPSLVVLGSFESPVPRLPPGTRRVTWGARPSFGFPVFGRHTAQARWLSGCGGELAGDLRTFSVPPWAPTLTAPAQGHSVPTASPALEGQALAGAAVALYVDGVPVGGTTGASFSATAPALAEGIHRWTATQSLNGATSPRAAEQSFTVDTVAPVTRLQAPGTGSLFRSSPVPVTGTATDVTSGVAHVEVSVQGGPWQQVQGTTAWSWSFTPPGDGTWRLAARAVDVAGNVEAGGPSVNVTYDATPPDTALTTAPSVQSRSASATFTFSASEPASGFQCSVDAAAWRDCNSPLELASLPDGLHAVEIRAWDLAGNMDPSPARHAWRVDTAAPTVTWGTVPPALAATPEATFQYTSDDPEALLSCALDASGFLPCASPRLVQGLQEGTHVMKVRGTDAAGNVGPELQWSWTVDTSPPTSTLTQPLPGTGLRTGPVDVRGVANDSGSGVVQVELSVNGGPWMAVMGTSVWQAQVIPGNQGLYQLAVRAVDAAGNVQAPSTGGSFLWDTVAPDSSFVITPPALTTSPDAHFELVSNEQPATFECRRDEGAWVPCPASHSLAALPDGTHVLELRALDAAGNVDASPARYTWRVDTHPPAVSFVPPPAPLSSAADADISFTATEPATFLCSVDGGPAFACSAPLHLGGLGHGDHLLSVRAVDAAGNEGLPASAGWTVDLVPPTVTLTAVPPAFAASSDATLGFSTSEPGQAECSADGRPFTACASPIGLAGLAEGPHQVEVRARDAAGNVGPAILAAWTVDTRPPTTSFSRTPAVVDPASTAEFQLASDEPARAWLCRLDGASLATPCENPARFEWLADGPHRAWAYAMDLAGNTDPVGASFEWTVDTSLPDTLVVSGPARWSNETEAVVQLDSTAPSAEYECALDGQPWSASGAVLQLSGLADGPHSLECRARNAAGTVDPSPALHAWTVDLAAPHAPVFAAVSPTSALPRLDGTTEPGTTLEWTLDGQPLPGVVVLPDGSFSGLPTRALAEGEHLLEGRAVDSAGNAGPFAHRAFFTDTVAPVVTLLSTPADPTGNSAARVEFLVADAHPDSSDCRLDGAGWLPCTSPALLTGLADGRHLLEVRAQDTAGNVGAPAAITWRVDTQPPLLWIAEAPPALTASRSATVRAEPGDGHATLECTLDGAPVLPCEAEFSETGLADGVHVFTAVAVDAAGNRSAPAQCAWTVDGTPPLVSLEGAPGVLTRDPRAAFNFHSSEAGALFMCALDGASAAPCHAPWVPSLLADGPHEASFSATDAAGNTSSAVTWQWRLDTEPPTISVTEGPTALSAITDAAFHFHTSEPSAVSCSLDGQPEVSCVPPWDAGPVHEGPHEVVLRPVDPAGNPGAPVRWAWEVDLTVPAVPSLEIPLANDSQPTLSGSAEPGALVEISVDGLPVGTVEAGPDGHFSLALPSPVADGAHVVTATARDAAGNAGAPGTLAFSTDTLAPKAVFVRAPQALDPSPRATFEFSADEPVTFACGLDGASLRDCLERFELEGLADGMHALALRAQDLAGNHGPVLLHAWTIDTVAPSVALQSTPGAWTRVPAATVAFSADDPSATPRCSLDGAAATPCSSPLVLGPLADGPHALELVATDAAGNSGLAEHVTWTQDTVAPTVAVVSAPDPLTSRTRAAVAFTPSEPAEISCALDGAQPIPCTSPALLDALAAGPHALALTATDAAGNAGPATEVRWTVDPSAPSAPVLAPLPSTVNSPQVEGTAEPGARISIQLDGQPLGEVEADATGHFTLPLPAPLSEGTHAFTAVATDAAGNTSLPARQAVLTDTVPPSVAITFGPAPLHNLPRAAFRFVASETASFHCALDGAAASPCGTPWMTAALSDGPHLLAVHGEDGVGNAGPAVEWRWASDSQVPTVQLAQRPAALERVDTATFAWTVSEPADSSCALDGAGWTACASPVTFTGLAEGDHRFVLRALDATGNLGPEVDVRWRVDTLAPETVLVQHPAPLVGNRLALLSFTSEPAARFDCSLDAEPFHACVVPAVFTSLVDGPHRFAVRAVDEAGNPDATPEAVDWEVDAREPDTEILSGPAEGELVGEDVAFAFSATLPDATFECSLDAADFQPCTAAWTLQFLPTAPHALAVRAVSRAGVVDPIPALRTWLTDPDALATRKVSANAPNCGCTQAGPAWPWWALVALAAGLKRKRAATRNRITAP